jgi:hypothetical protein
MWSLPGLRRKVLASQLPKGKYIHSFDSARPMRNRITNFVVAKKIGRCGSVEIFPYPVIRSVAQVAAGKAPSC